MTFGEKIEKATNETLKKCFIETAREVCGVEPTKKKISDIQIGKPVFHNGLTFIVSRKNGITILSDGTEIDFLTSVKEYLLTI